MPSSRARSLIVDAHDAEGDVGVALGGDAEFALAFGAAINARVSSLSSGRSFSMVVLKRKSLASPCPCGPAHSEQVTQHPKTNRQRIIVCVFIVNILSIL